MYPSLDMKTPLSRKMNECCVFVVLKPDKSGDSCQMFTWPPHSCKTTYEIAYKSNI